MSSATRPNWRDVKLGGELSQANPDASLGKRFVARISVYGIRPIDRVTLFRFHDDDDDDNDNGHETMTKAYAMSRLSTWLHPAIKGTSGVTSDSIVDGPRP